MSEDAFPVRASEAEVRMRLLTFTGTGASAPTVVYGRGITMSWISTGLYEATFNENPGTFIGFSAEFMATTASAVKGFTAVAGVFNTTTLKLRISVTNAAETLTDLAALQQLSLILLFKEAGV